MSDPSEFAFFDPAQGLGHVKGNLPHWRQEGVVYFVTFRTADSMPQVKLRAWEAAMRAGHADAGQFHAWLDNGYGACWLARSELRELVERSLRHFDGMRYGLDELVVASNHVHALVQPWPPHELSAIVQLWKSFSARQLNTILGRRGAFWQKESFDHIVRGAEQLERIRAYIRAHPGARGS